MVVKVDVFVSLKPSVRDAQGMTIHNSLKSFGYDVVKDVRQGKTFSLVLDVDSDEKATALVDDMCRKMLVNGVVEKYSCKIVS